MSSIKCVDCGRPLRLTDEDTGTNRELLEVCDYCYKVYDSVWMSYGSIQLGISKVHYVKSVYYVRQISMTRIEIVVIISGWSRLFRIKSIRRNLHKIAELRLPFSWSYDFIILTEIPKVIVS